MTFPFKVEFNNGNKYAQAAIRGYISDGISIQDWLLSKETKRIKEDKESYSAVIDLSDLKLGLVFLKVYYRKSLKRRLQYLLGKARGLRTWNVQKKLLSADLKIPAPIAYLDDGEVECLLSSFIPNARDLRSFMGDPSLNSQFRQLKLGAHFVDLVASFHRKGFVHGDCKWGNLLWVEGAEQLLFVDFDGAGVYSKTLAAKDIARFIVNAEEAGISAELMTATISQYAALMNEDVAVLKDRIQPIIDNIKARHQRKRLG